MNKMLLLYLCCSTYSIVGCAQERQLSGACQRSLIVFNNGISRSLPTPRICIQQMHKIMFIMIIIMCVQLSISTCGAFICFYYLCTHTYALLSLPYTLLWVCVDCYSCSRINEVQVRVCIGFQPCIFGFLFVDLQTLFSSYAQFCLLGMPLQPFQKSSQQNLFTKCCYSTQQLALH